MRDLSLVLHLIGSGSPSVIKPSGAKRRDLKKAKIKDVRSNLMDAMSRQLTKAGRSAEVGMALVEISNAPIEMFKPQIWRLELQSVGSRLKSGHQYPDEYLVEDLSDAEFQI